MRAITICEPWASLIASGHKPIENRTWRARHTGTIAIHAGKSLAWWCRVSDDPDAWLARYGIPLPKLETLAFGAVVAIATLEDVVRLADLPPDLAGNPFAEGPWCWILRDVRPLANPLPYTGTQMLWDLPDDLVAKALAA